MSPVPVASQAHLPFPSTPVPTNLALQPRVPLFPQACLVPAGSSSTEGLLTAARHLRSVSSLVSEELSPSGGPRVHLEGAWRMRVLTLCHPGLSSLRPPGAPRPPCVPPSAFGLPACFLSSFPRAGAGSFLRCPHTVTGVAKVPRLWGTSLVPT